MTVFEQHILSDLASWYIQQVRDAIKTKPITRKTKKQGEFSAVVNASGKLSDSLRFDISDKAINIYCLSYIDKLIYGQAPGRIDNTSVFEIENWIATKGLNLNAVSVMNNLQANGSSIYQKHLGANSGLLSGISLEQKVNEAKEKLTLLSVKEIKEDFLNQFKNAA